MSQSAMQRINVIGTTGSGKSTFSKTLAESLGYPYIQMDQLYWKRHWQEPETEEFIQKLEAAITDVRWVLDGNYNRTNELKWQKADTIIWLDYSYSRTLFQLLRRTIQRTLEGKELWPDTENYETLRRSFLSRKSIIFWFFKFYKRNRERYSHLMESPEYKHIRRIRITSPRQAYQFLSDLKSNISVNTS